MLLLLQGDIFLKGPIPLFPSVTALVNILLHASCHMSYVAGVQVIIVDDPKYQSPIAVLLIWLEICPYVRSLEDCKYLFPNQRSVGNERVGEWTNFFRVSSKRRIPNDN